MQITPHPSIALLILHFKDWEMTKACLDSIQKSILAPNLNLQVIVLDNSQDKKSQPLLASHPIVTKLLTPDKNLGFAGGNNLAAKWAIENGAEYLMLLNNDTEINPDTIQNLFDGQKKHPEIGIMGAVIEHQVLGQTWYDYGGVIHPIKGQPRHKNKQTYTSSDKIILRDFVSGCCMFLNKDLWLKLRGLDESYFMYLEDVDFCCRARRLGYKIGVCVKASLFHKGSQSTSEWQKIKFSWRNSIRFSLSNIPLPFKITAVGYNFCFYPALYLRWKLGHLKRKIKKLWKN